MSRLAHQIGLRPFALLSSFVSFVILGIPAAARTVPVECAENRVSQTSKALDSQASNTAPVAGTCHDSIGVNDFSQLTILRVSDDGKNPQSGL